MTTTVQPATITFRRNDDVDVKERHVYARIDDGPTQALKFGDSVTLEIAEGEHRLRANNTLFWKTVPFTVAPGEHVTFAFINKAPWIGLNFIAYLIGGVPLQLIIKRQ